MAWVHGVGVNPLVLMRIGDLPRIDRDELRDMVAEAC
jgi:hypothetical protein